MKAAGTKRARTARSKKAGPARQKSEMKKDRFANQNPKLAELARKQWPEKGREERIARAKQALGVAFVVGSKFKKLDPETIKWIAENPDLEYL
jgi:hypothetical protein